MKKLGLILLILGFIVWIAGCGSSKKSASYKTYGYGVISQATYALQSLSVPGTGGTARLKESIAQNVIPGLSQSVGVNSTFHALSTSPIWGTSLKYIYLTWDVIPWAIYYRVYLVGTANYVWDSRDKAVPTEDPVFSLSSPKAYLDISVELDQKVTAPGSYQFKVVGYDNSGRSYEFAPITVSIGTLLTSFPSSLQENAGQLSWGTVSGAGGYTVGIFHDSIDIANLVWKSSTLQSGTTLTLPAAVTTGRYYYYAVNAHALDTAGNTVEITNAISGFNY